jgi:MFS family permease
MKTKPRADMVLAAAVAMATLFGVQGTATAVPAIQKSLGVSDGAIGLFAAVYLIPGVALAVPLGYLSDRVGRRFVFVSMTALYGLAGGAQALVNDYGAMLVLRFLQGIGFAALMPLTIALIGDVYRGKAQIRAQASRQVAMTTAEFATPIIGAACAAWSWRATLGIQALVLPLGLPGLFVLKDHGPKRMFERYRAALRKAVARPGMNAVLLAGFVRYLGKFALVSYLPLMLVRDRGASLTEAAVVVSVAAGMAALVSLPAVRMLQFAPASVLMLSAIFTVGVSFLGFALASTWQAALIPATVFGIADGTLGVLQNGMVVEATPASVRGGLLAVSAMTRNAGKIVAPLAMGAMVLAFRPSVSFAVVGLCMWALLPSLRRLRALDELMSTRPDLVRPAIDTQ